ncbi:MAG TPA: MFS transporter [Xanthobacteraceae bacterium]|nr:MFS transporter [Xanthobacteraceae bacterium]
MRETPPRTRASGPVQGRLRRIARTLSAEPAPLAILTRQSWHPWLVVGLVCLGAMIGQLDATIVQLALPTLGRTFAASLETVSWVALAYLVAFASCLPVFGRLCDMFGRKQLYLAGYLLFVLASLACGLAPDLPWLIGFRVLQGIGGALLGANSIAILVKAIDPGRRGRALGIFAAAQAIGMSAGPAVGGVVLETLGWQWVFWVSVPFGLAAGAVGWLVLPQTEHSDRAATFDGRGALLIGPALILLVIALNHVASWGATSPLTLALTASSALLLWLLVRQERAVPFPLVDLALFRSRGFACGAVAVVLGYAMLYGMFFLMAFALEHGHGDSPRAAGLRLAIIPVALGLVAPFSGTLSARLGVRRLGVAGMVACLCAVLLLALAQAEPDASRWIGATAFALFGAGLGVFIAPNNHATIEAAPARLAGEAGALLNLMRVLGSSLGVASASSTLAWRLQAATGRQGDWIDFPGHPLLGAVESSLVVLALMAAAAAMVSLLRGTGRPQP